MLVECAIADAYGIGFEFVPNSPNRPNDLLRYYQHPTYDDMVPGHYSDDTQRSVANALVLLDSNGVGDERLYNPLTYLKSYQDTFARDPRAGYSRRFEAFLRDNLTTPIAEMALRLKRKSTNGSLMGVAVLGNLPTIEGVMLASAAQALSTHSYGTIPFAQIVALSAHYAIYNIGKMENLSPWLHSHLHGGGKNIDVFLRDSIQEERRPDTVTMGASSVVKLLLWGLPRHNRLSQLVKLAVDVGGDTDSAAAVMISVASECSEYLNDLPADLYQTLENEQFGRDYLVGLDHDIEQWRTVWKQ